MARKVLIASAILILICLSVAASSAFLGTPDPRSISPGFAAALYRIGLLDPGKYGQVILIGDSGAPDRFYILKYTQQQASLRQAIQPVDSRGKGTCRAATRRYGWKPKQIHNRFFRHHQVAVLFDTSVIPCRTQVAAIDDRGRLVFLADGDRGDVLWPYYNQIAGHEGIRLDNSSEVEEYCRFIAQLALHFDSRIVFPRSNQELHQMFSSISASNGWNGTYPKDLDGITIHPPIITPVEGGYEVSFFSWAEYGGSLTRWNLKISKDGRAAGKGTALGGSIGPYFGRM